MVVISLILLVACASPVAIGAPKQKKSAKLVKKMQQASSPEFIDVIVKTTVSRTNGLTNDLNGHGAQLKKGHSSFNFKAYRIKQADIDAIVSTCTNFVQIATVCANSKAYSATGLAANTAYRFRIRAFNGRSYSFYSNAASRSTLSR